MHQQVTLPPALQKPKERLSDAEIAADYRLETAPVSVETSRARTIVRVVGHLLTVEGGAVPYETVREGVRNATNRPTTWVNGVCQFQNLEALHKPPEVEPTIVEGIDWAGVERLDERIAAMP